MTAISGFWRIMSTKKETFRIKTIFCVSHDIVPATMSLCRLEASVHSCAFVVMFKIYCHIQNFCYIIDSDIFFNFEYDSNMKTVPTLATYPDILATSSRVLIPCMESLSLSFSTLRSGSVFLRNLNIVYYAHRYSMRRR